MSNTVLDHLIEHLRAKDVALDGQERPAAILWTDPKGEWRPLIETMRTRVEELLELGEYAPEARTGPAIWIRCLVDKALAEPALSDDRVPIVYLPGVARQDLRAGQECREELRPLVELMFRGTLWLQHNGSDWRVSTFLTSTRALGLDIARDNASSEAMLRALVEVAMTPVSQLRGRHLQGDDFDRMLSDDVIRDLLRWMEDQAGTKARLGENRWGAFRSQCQDEFDLDPEVEADVTAGERLGKREGKWANVWARFKEAPTSFPGIAELLRRSRPSDIRLFDDREPWPEYNDNDEDEVRKALKRVTNKPHNEACDAVVELESTHGKRRGWVWARLGLSPMAMVLEPLSRLAATARSAVGGTTPDEVAAAYIDRGWQGDAASWEAIATAPTADEPLVKAVVRHLLEPWLEDSARAFQTAVGRSPLPGHGEQLLVEAGEDACVLFVDGLRYDLGQRLGERLEGRGCRVTVNHRWAGTPTVTATAKPAVTPVEDAVVGKTIGEEFTPNFESTGKSATAQNLRESIRERGYQILGLKNEGAGTFPVPMSQPARGWLEAGKIDTLGHKLESRLARQIGDELDRLADRISSLLDEGWRAVRVVTDHGWLLLPGGLPKVDLPKHLTESRWARCAVIAGDSTPDVARAAWYWNAGQSFATAPGIACFNKTEKYAHGGLSVQECLIPDILVERGEETRLLASIKSVTWRGMRCFVEASASGAGVSADLRLERPIGRSVAAKAKLVEDDGSVNLLLDGDEHEHAQLVLVLIDDSKNILAQKPTRVGDDS